MFTNEFISLCKSYAENRTDVLDENIDNSKKMCTYSIEFNSYILEFRYVKKESVYVKPSSMYCVLKLRKNSVVHYHLTDIIPFLENKTFNSCYFWCIETIERLNSCFKSLETTLDRVLSQLESLLSDDTALVESLFESYRIIYNLKQNDIDFGKIDDKNDYAHSYFLSLQKMRDEFVFSRYSNFAPYALLLKNNFDKAFKKYEKLNQKNKLFEYEKILIKHISDSDDSAFNPFESDTDTSASDKFMSIKILIKSCLICYIIFSVLFCSLFAVYNAVVSKDTIVFLASSWHTGFLCAGLCSVFGALAFFQYIPDKHLTKTERCNYSKVLFSKGAKAFSATAFALSVVVSIFFAIMIMTSNVSFYNDRVEFDDQSYNYNQIDSVYLIQARYNVYDERIERSSYVILFDDKTSLDLDGYTSVETTEKDVLPIFENKGIPVGTADSERDLPWYTEYE